MLRLAVLVTPHLYMEVLVLQIVQVIRMPPQAMAQYLVALLEALVQVYRVVFQVQGRRLSITEGQVVKVVLT